MAHMQLRQSATSITPACYAIFFFFQAEDGIRDDLVTGVQTCALPILMANPVADSITISGSFARNAGQSRFRYGHANGSSMKNAPIHRTQDSVIGGTWPAT